MGRILNLIYVEKTLHEKGFKIFTPWEFAGIFNTSLISGQKFLERYTQKGVFIRAKKGLYLFDWDWSHEVILANKVYSPSYVSLETALSYYSIIPEVVYSITSVTCKATREFSIDGRAFEYRKIKKEAYIGYTPKEFSGKIGLIAQPEKALVDYLYFVALGEKSLNDRLNLRNLDWIKVKQYTRLFKREGLERIVNDISKRA